MGPIQASLNQLTLSAIGAVGGLAHGLKGSFKKPQAPKSEQPQAETQSGMGNIAKVGKDYSRTNLRAYSAAAKSVDSANDAIKQKATSRLSPIASRLEQIKAATSLSVADDTKGGSK